MHLFLTILGWIGLYYLMAMFAFVAMLFIYPDGHFLPAMILATVWPIGFPLAVVIRFWPSGRRAVFNRLPAGFADGGPVSPQPGDGPWT